MSGRCDHVVRSRRLRAGVGLLMSITLSAPAQVLDLDAASSFPETPISVLDEIVASVTRDLPAQDLTTDTGIVRASGATLRRVIAELASRGRGAGDGDAAAGLTAIRLADSIDGIERRLERLATPGSFTGSPPLRLEENARRRGLDRLEVFSRSALDVLRRRPTTDLEEYDDTITMVLAPIVDAFEVLERGPLLDRWPALAEIRTGGVTPNVPGLPPLPDRPGLEDLDRRLRAGGDDADPRLHRRFRDAAAAAAALAPGSPATAPVLATLDAATSESGEPLRRRLESLEIASAVAADIEAIGSTPARRDAAPDTLAGMLASILATPPDDTTLVLLERQRTTVGLIASGARFEVASLDRDLRAAARSVQQRHRRIVRSTVATLLEIGAVPSAMGDPDAVGALQALEGSIADLERLRTAGDLALRMTSIRPGAVREFQQRMREWCRMLARDATQAEGATAIDTVARDLDRFAAMPAEAWLAARGPDVIDRTGGRGADLLDRITETRRRWADEIFHAELDGPARAELVRLARLGDLLVALNAVLVRGDDEVAAGLAACDRWAGWFATPDRLVWTARQLAPALRLACTTAADGDAARLERDLDQLENAAPPAAVVAWLASHVSRPLADLPSGSIGAVAAAGLPPDRDAWGLSHRAALARICRAFAEIESARARDEEAAVAELTAWVVAACDDLMDNVRMRASFAPRERD